MIQLNVLLGRVVENDSGDETDDDITVADGAAGHKGSDMKEQDKDTYYPLKVVDTSDKKLNLCCTRFVSAVGYHSKAHSLVIFSRKEICQH
jgi:hypothetical protein